MQNVNERKWEQLISYVRSVENGIIPMIENYIVNVLNETDQNVVDDLIYRLIKEDIIEVINPTLKTWKIKK